MKKVSTIMGKFLKLILACVISCTLSSCEVLLLGLAGALMGSDYNSYSNGYLTPPNPYDYISATTVQPTWNNTYSNWSTANANWGTGVATVSTTNETNTNSSGSKNSTFDETHGYKDCHMCLGSGVCKTCNGKGWYIGGVGLETLPCPNCDSNHNGKCQWCHGTGKVYGRL